MAEREPLPRTIHDLAISYPGVCFDINGESYKLGVPLSIPGEGAGTEFRLVHGLTPPPPLASSPPAPAPAPASARANLSETLTILSGLLRGWEEVLRNARAGMLARGELEEQREALLGEAARIIVAFGS